MDLKKEIKKDGKNANPATPNARFEHADLRVERNLSRRVGSTSLGISINDITPDVVLQIEQQLGKDIDELCTSNISNLTLRTKSGEFNDNFRLILTRIANKAGISLAQSRLYLSKIKDGESETKAVAEAKRQLSSIPVENITANVVKQIEKQLGININDMLLDNISNLNLRANSSDFKDNFKSILQRISRKTGLSLSQSRSCLSKIKDGISFTQASEDSKNSFLCIPIEKISMDVVGQIEQQLGMGIDHIFVNNGKNLSLKVNGNKYDDKFDCILIRIGIKTGLSRTQSRLFLSKIREGKTEAEAIAESKILFQGIPIEKISAEIIEQVENQLGKGIKEISTKNMTVIALKADGNQYTANFHSILQRIRIKNDLSLSQSRLYLSYIREGKTQAEAFYLVKNPRAIERENQNKANDAMKDIFE